MGLLFSLLWIQNVGITPLIVSVQTRFTVQFNLFAGTILALGNEEQVLQIANRRHFG